MALFLWKIAKRSSTFIKNAGEYPATLSLVAFTGTNKDHVNSSQVIFGFTTNNSEIVYKFYLLDMNEDKPLYKDLETLCGDHRFMDENFELFSLLDTQVLLSVSVKSDEVKTYPVVDKISPLDENLEFDTRKIKLIKFSFEDIEQFDLLPPWMQRNIELSNEWQELNNTPD